MAKKSANTAVSINEESAQVLNPVYVKLNKLQSVVAKKFEIEEKKNEIPKDLEDKKAVLLKTNAAYLELHDKSEKVKEEIKNLADSLITAAAQREADEKKMETISLSREFDTLTKQIEDDKNHEQALRKTLITKKDFAADLETKLSVQEAVMADQEAEVKEEENRMDALMAECNREQEECERQIAEGSENIPSEILRKFERIIKNKQGVGIVPVHGIECMGCHMTLPLQFVNEVRAVSFKNEIAEDEIQFCPYCSRVLYYEKADGADVISFVPEQEEEAEESGSDNSFMDAIGDVDFLSD